MYMVSSQQPIHQDTVAVYICIKIPRIGYVLSRTITLIQILSHTKHINDSLQRSPHKG